MKLQPNNFAKSGAATLHDVLNTAGDDVIEVAEEPLDSGYILFIICALAGSRSKLVNRRGRDQGANGGRYSDVNFNSRAISTRS